MIQDMAYLGECSMDTLKKMCIPVLLGEVFYIYVTSVRSGWLIVLFNSSVSLLSFWLVVLTIAKSGC